MIPSVPRVRCCCRWGKWRCNGTSQSRPQSGCGPPDEFGSFRFLLHNDLVPKEPRASTTNITKTNKFH